MIAAPSEDIQAEHPLEHSLDVLGFGRIREEIANLCRTPKAAERALSLSPMENIEDIRYSMGVVQELRELISGSSGFYLTGLTDITPQLELASKDGKLDTEGLVKVAEIAEISEALRRIGINNKGKFLHLSPLMSSLYQTPQIPREVKKMIELPDGIKDDATPHLVEIARRISSVRDKIQTKLDRIMHNQEISDLFQDEFITIRNDRFVLPVRTDRSGQFDGVVHDRSDSGATLFMEPLSIIPDNNELKNLRLEQRAEYDRILVSLSQLVARYSAPLHSNLEILITLDYYTAIAELADRLDAHIPVVGTKQFVLQKAYNPLLLMEKKDDKSGAPTGTPHKQEIVPLNFSMSGHIKGFLITGPNMGGKTVALKTAGLLSVMALSGLPIPASSKSSIPYFRSFFADIGDEQSIEYSLSSFASHIKRWTEAVEGADEHSLVLLDELGAATDPDEGIPLIEAMLEHLLEHKARIIATTHIGSLKAFANDRKDMENCSLVFDEKTLSPTYRFRQGIPERSWAIPIALRLHFPPKIVERSRTLSDKDKLRLENLLRDLSHQVTELERERTDLKQKLIDAAQNRDKLKGLLARQKELIDDLNRRREEIERTAQSKIELMLMKERETLQKRISKALENNESIKTEKIAEEIRQIQQDVSHRIKELRHKYREHKGKLRRFEKGDVVYLPRLRKRGDVVAPTDDAGYIKVAVGRMTLRIHSSSAEFAKKNTVKKTHRMPQHLDTAKIPTKIDTRGLTFEESWEKIDPWLDSVYQQGIERIVIIHGKGTGQLGRKIQLKLSSDKRVKRAFYAEPPEGGLGATIVLVKTDDKD